MSEQSPKYPDEAVAAQRAPRAKPINLKRHREDDYIDEVRIIVRERYKTSGLSGDEWRFHRVIQTFRKGILLFERPFNGSVQTVAGFLPWVLADAMESHDGPLPDTDALCFQPGCSETATSEYEIIEEFGRQGDRLHPDESGYHSARRRFCQKHLRRGDCSREDSDASYRVVSGYGPDGADMESANVVASRVVTVKLDDLAGLPGAIAKAVRDV